MKSKRGKAPAVQHKRKLSRDTRIPVFEGTIGDRKLLFDAKASSLISLAEITGQSPKDYADRNNMRIVNRSEVAPAVVKTLKKTWAVAKAELTALLASQKKSRKN